MQEAPFLQSLLVLHPVCGGGVGVFAGGAEDDIDPQPAPRDASATTTRRNFFIRE